MLRELNRFLYYLVRIASQQYDPQPGEPDDLTQAKDADQSVQRWDDRDDAHRADGQAEDVQSFGQPARPQRR